MIPPRITLALAAGVWFMGILSQAAALPTKAGPVRPKPAFLAEYRTVDEAIKARPSPVSTSAAAQPGYLGVELASTEDGGVLIADVDGQSPAARAGLRPGDRLLRIDASDVGHPDEARNVIDGLVADDVVKLAVRRAERIIETKAALVPWSRPMKPGPQRPYLGLQVDTNKEGEGVVISDVAARSPAGRAQLKVGEVILKVDGADLDSPAKFRELINARRPDDVVTLTLLLADKPVEYKVQVGGEDASRPGFGARTGFDTRGMRYWQREVFRLAVVTIDYPDAKHNPNFGAKAWEEALFSRDAYKRTASNQPAYGSLADYYFEQSFGKLRVVGKAFEAVEVAKKRAEYGEGTNRFALLTEALDKLLERDGTDALRDFDGICFLYAGGRMQVARGSLYWPHRSTVSHRGKRWPYYICPEGGERMPTISVFCHEFGHMLGLPDLYARPENPGSEGLSVWCAMSNQVNNGRPQHFCAWAKERLGWITPTVIDPTVKQKLILGPIWESPKECIKILARADGSEYFLLENRRRLGFDQSLPAEGLLIWRVVGNRPILEESHGVEGPAGPRVFQNAVPFPSAANDAFTPITIPSSRSQLGGGLPVYVTNVRQLPDGRITFHVGYEYH